MTKSRRCSLSCGRHPSCQRRPSDLVPARTNKPWPCRAPRPADQRDGRWPSPGSEGSTAGTGHGPRVLDGLGDSQCPLSKVSPELLVAVELVAVEPLVGGAVAGEPDVVLGVLENLVWKIFSEGCLCVDELGRKRSRRIVGIPDV